MKQILTLGLFLLFFGGTPPPPRAIKWQGTYQCYQAFYKSARTQSRQDVALEIKLLSMDTDSVVTIRNIVNRKMRVLRVSAVLGEVNRDGTLSLGFRVVETATGEAGILSLNFQDDKLTSISLIGSELATVLTVYYPLYLKV